MAMDMNFAPRMTWRWGAFVVLVAALAVGAYGLWQRHELLEQRAALVSRFEARQRLTVKSQPPPQAAVKRESIEETDKLIAGLQRPWEAMLNALQEEIRGDVLVTRLQPEEDGFRLRISGQADSSQAFLDFIQRLQRNASWRAVYPIAESRQPSVIPGGKPTVFQLGLEWRR